MRSTVETINKTNNPILVLKSRKVKSRAEQIEEIRRESARLKDELVEHAKKEEDVTGIVNRELVEQTKVAQQLIVDAEKIVDSLNESQDYSEVNSELARLEDTIKADIADSGSAISSKEAAVETLASKRGLSWINWLWEYFQNSWAVFIIITIFVSGTRFLWDKYVKPYIDNKKETPQITVNLSITNNKRSNLDTISDAVTKVTNFGKKEKDE